MTTGRTAVYLTVQTSIVALCILTGCNHNYQQSGTSPGRPMVGAFSAKEDNPFLQRDKKPADSQAVQVTVYQVTIRNQDENTLAQLWKLAKPAQLVKTDAGFLARNGLQIAAGNAQTWPKVVRLLGVAQAEPEVQKALAEPTPNSVKRTDTWLAQGFVAELSLSSSPGGATLFWYEPQGQLRGQTYENCRKLLVTTAVAKPTGQVQIKLIPALKHQDEKLRVLRRLAVLGGLEPEVYLAKFEALAFEVLVNPQEFLIIGSPAGAGEMSFGRAFFNSNHADQSVRMVLLIIPRVLAGTASK